MRDALLAGSRAHVARARQQAGCVSHEFLVDQANPDRLVFIEEWADMDALGAHLANEETRAFGALCASAGGGASIRIMDARLLRQIG